MADLADMLVGSALQTSKEVPDISGSIQKGAQLAQAVNEIQTGREKLEMAKQQHMMDKATRIMDAIEKGSQFKDKAAQNLFFKNYVPGMVKALKMEEFFNPQLMEYVQQSPEVRDKLLGLRLDMQDKIQRGELRGADIWNYAKSKLSPEELPLLDTDSLLEQQKFAASEEGKNYRTATTIAGAGQRQATQIASAGNVEVAKDLGSEFAKFKGAGGEAKVDSEIAKIDSVINAFESGQLKTGGISKGLPLIGSDRAQAYLDPDLKAANDTIKGAINIKSILDSQFSDAIMKETQKNLGIDNSLPNEKNVERLKALKTKLLQEKRTKVQAFRDAGFLVGPADISKALSPKRAAFKKLPKAEQNKAIKALAEKFKVTDEEVRKALGGE